MSDRLETPESGGWGASNPFVARDFLAIFCIVLAGLLVYSNLSGLWQQGATGGCGSQSGPYLTSVLLRSMAAPYQIALLAGLLAVPLHFVWTAWRMPPLVGRAEYAVFSLWAQTLFTSLGFLGTIIGISLAVAGLEAAMLDGEPGGLICGLSTAFDTTFLGLVASILLLMLRKIIQPGQVDP